MRVRQEVAAAAISATPLSYTTPLLASSPPLSQSQYTTPQKISEIDAMRSHTRGLLVGAGVDARALAAYDKIMKGAMAGLHAGAQAITQLYNMEIAKDARELQAKQSRKAVGHARHGPMRLKNARATMRDREDDTIDADNAYLIEVWENEAVDAEFARMQKAGELLDEDYVETHLRLFLYDLRAKNERVIIEVSDGSEVEM